MEEKKNFDKPSTRSIYDFNKEELLSADELKNILERKLLGKSYYGLPLRTRSRVVKEDICIALEYLIPRSFKKTKPKFICQNFDVYMQKSNNMQIWNDEIDVNRRYVILRLDENDAVDKIVVITGSELIKLDTTGKLTIKYQALLKPSDQKTELVNKFDTEYLIPKLAQGDFEITSQSPIDQPVIGELLSVEEIYNKTKKLVGVSFDNEGIIQERNRAYTFHKLVCECLGYKTNTDNGQFPDILNQLLEVKLQTSQTVDLGAQSPDSDLIIVNLAEVLEEITPRDIRYILGYAEIIDEKVIIQNIYVLSGAYFYSRIPQMLGKKVNSKIQIPLPNRLFE